MYADGTGFVIHEGKQMEEEIAKQVQVEYLIHALKEISQESERDDKRWSIQLEVANLFEVSLRLVTLNLKMKSPSFYLAQRRSMVITNENQEESSTLATSNDREGICDIGFVTIKLSGKWVAKSILKMLRDGIDTWAPKLLLKSVLVNFPSCDMADLTQMDLLRRELIKTTSIRMLEYCKIDAEFIMPCEMALPQEQLDKFRIEKRDAGDVLIFRNAEEEREPLIHVKRDGWYGFKTKTACWIVCVTPVQQQEYIKMCIKAAKHATWLPRDWWVPPKVSFTGYQTYNTELKHEDLNMLLEKAKISCSAAAKELGYTGEQVSNCVL
ncbi:hypothetical protein Tco_1374205, partial [Tanacetum coccineum]